MTLEHIHGPAFMLRYRDAQRAVLDYAEAVADGRRQGTLTKSALDRLVSAQKELDRYRQLYIRAQDESAAAA